MATRVGGGVGATGGTAAWVGLLLPWTIVLVVVIPCRGFPYLSSESYDGFQLLLAAGLVTSSAAWLIFLAAPFVLFAGVYALIEKPPLWVIRLQLGATIMALLAIASVYYLFARGAVSIADGSLFRGFGSGLWVTLMGFACALLGGAVMHGAVRTRRFRVPPWETLLALCACGLLVVTGVAAATTPPPATSGPLSLQCNRPGTATPAPSQSNGTSSSSTLYVAAQSEALALRTDNGSVRWSCHYLAGGFESHVAPVLIDGTVLFVTRTPVPNTYSWYNVPDVYLYAFRAADGAFLWRTRLDGDVPWTPVVADGVIYVTTTRSTAVEGGAIYPTTTRSTVYAVQASDGTLLWSAATVSPTGEQPSGGPTWPSPLVVANEVVYGVSPDLTFGVYAIDARDGTLQWKHPLATAPQLPSIQVADGQVYGEGADLNSSTIHLFALDALTGQSRWIFPLTQNLSVPQAPRPPTQMRFPAQPFAVASGVVYGTDNAAPPQAPDLFALRAADGRLLWGHHAPAGTPPTTRHIAVADGTVYVVYGTLDAGGAVALSASDGSVLWSVPPVEPTQGDQGDDVASLVVASGVVYCLTLGGQLTALAAESGSVLSQFHVASTRSRPANALSQFVASPSLVVDGSTGYLAADSLSALDARAGALLWQFTAPAPLPGSWTDSGVETSPPALGP